MKNLLISTKDVIQNINRPGIYAAHCNTDGCDAIYIGQTTRELKVRASEHLKHIEKNDLTKLNMYMNTTTNSRLIVSRLLKESKIPVDSMYWSLIW